VEVRSEGMEKKSKQTNFAKILAGNLAFARVLVKELEQIGQWVPLGLI
jgi:hypothetical protein